MSNSDAAADEESSGSALPPAERSQEEPLQLSRTAAPIEQTLWRRYQVAPGLIDTTAGSQLAQRVSRFEGEGMPMLNDIQRRWQSAEPAPAPDAVALQYSSASMLGRTEASSPMVTQGTRIEPLAMAQTFPAGVSSPIAPALPVMLMAAGTDDEPTNEAALPNTVAAHAEGEAQSGDDAQAQPLPAARAVAAEPMLPLQATIQRSDVAQGSPLMMAAAGEAPGALSYAVQLAPLAFAATANEASHTSAPTVQLAPLAFTAAANEATPSRVATPPLAADGLARRLDTDAPLAAQRSTVEGRGSSLGDLIAQRLESGPVQRSIQREELAEDQPLAAVPAETQAAQLRVDATSFASNRTLDNQATAVVQPSAAGDSALPPIFTSAESPSPATLQAGREVAMPALWPGSTLSRHQAGTDDGVAGLQRHMPASEPFSAAPSQFPMPAEAVQRSAASVPSLPPLLWTGNSMAAPSIMNAPAAVSDGRVNASTAPGAWSDHSAMAPLGAAAAAHPPSFDMDELVEQVSNLLLRQLAIEQERRGVGKW